MPKTIVLGTERFEYLAERLVQCTPTNFELGRLNNSTFPNGESRLEVLDFGSIRDREILLIGGTEREDLFDLQMYAGEIAQVARRLNILIPFFRYATQERKDEGCEGHIVIAKGIARAISSLPRAARGNRVFLVDPHTESLAQYFDDTKIRAETLRCSKLIQDLINEQFSETIEQVVIGSVDDGRPTLLKQVASALNLPLTVINKERVSGTETKVLGSANIEAVAGKIVVMVDDMARTLGSALGAAEAYRSADAREVWLFTTHPDYSPDAIASAQKAGLLDGVITTNSYHSYLRADGKFAIVKPIEGFLAEQLTGSYGL